MISYTPQDFIGKRSLGIIFSAIIFLNDLGFSFCLYHIAGSVGLVLKWLICPGIQYLEI
jgi:hypothetical protein